MLLSLSLSRTWNHPEPSQFLPSWWTTSEHFHWLLFCAVLWNHEIEGALNSGFCGSTYLSASELKWSWDPFWSLGKLPECITKNNFSILFIFLAIYQKGQVESNRTSGICLKGLVEETWINCCGLFDFTRDVWVSRYLATF